MNTKTWIRPMAWLSALLILASGASLVLGKGDSSTDDTYNVTAYFEKAIGLFPKSDVNVLGVPVGKVTSVEPVGSRVRVDMEISKKHKVPSDAFAQIVPISVISDRYVQLAPPYVGGPALADGAVLDLNRTQIPAELDDVFKQLKKLLDAIEPGKEGEPGALGDLIVQLNDTLSNKEEDLQGTLSNTAQLTRTLSRARGDLSGLLVNLDDLFGKLATRAGSFGTLNKNLALVMTALAESRRDLQDTLHNLGDLTGEVSSLVKEHRQTLGVDLKIAARIAGKVLKNRDSVVQSLRWLPVVAIGFINANEKYPGTKITAENVRDNAENRIQCELFEMFEELPDELKDICNEHNRQSRARQTHVDLSPVPKKLDCRQGVRKVKRQLRRMAEVGLPDDVKDEVLKPLRKKLRKLARKCEELGTALTDPDELLDRLLEDIPDVGDVPDLDDPVRDVSGNAAGSAIATEPEPGFAERIGGWMSGFFGFVGLR